MSPAWPATERRHPAAAVGSRSPGSDARPTGRSIRSPSSTERCCIRCRSLPVLQETIPAQANTIAHRQTTPLYGAGLVEAIPDSAIELGAATPKPNGVNGKAALVTDEATGQVRVGRFGWKAQHATLLTFAGDAYTNEIGITNRVFPIQPAPNGNTALLAQFVSLAAGPKDVPDPVTGKADIDRFSDYLRYLAPPPRGPASALCVAGRA